jgi:uncharacterized membrane protein (UPF0127 family)
MLSKIKRRKMDPKQPMTYLICLFLLLSWLNFESFGAKICDYPEMATVKISRKGHIIKAVSVTLATTSKKRQRGLMYCPALPYGTGMLFIYPDAKPRTFWMKNTLIELAIIFILADGRIAAIERGEPGSLDHIQSPADIQSVLELNYGESRDLMIGDNISLWVNSNEHSTQ